MVYHVDADGVRPLESASFDAIDVTEAEIEDWIAHNPAMLGEELLVIASRQVR